MSSPRTLVVAVTGHRLNQLPEPERPRIQAEIARCLDEAQAAAREAVGGRVNCVLHSAIAEGATATPPMRRWRAAGA